MKYYSIFAQAYGEGNYGECLYNGSSTTQQCSSAAGGTAGGNSGSGSLPNTGITLVAILTIACLVIFVSLIVRAWKRKPVPVVQEIEEVEGDAEKRFSDRF